MSKAVKIRLPDYLHDQVKELAKEEGVSVDQFIALALAEKMSALKTVSYLKGRAERGSREKFDRVLSKVPDVEPRKHDKL